MTEFIEKLGFETSLFNYSVGKVQITDLDQLNELKGYRLVYLRPANSQIDNELHKIYSQRYVKISLKATLEHVNEVDPNVTSLSNSNLTEEILQLSYQSGYLSRFLLDKNFVQKEFYLLYKKWIENSLNGQIAHEVLGYRLYGRIIGLITLKESHNHCNIGLLAVDEEFRGQKIGKKLIGAAISFCQKREKITLTVSTQETNYSALKFYKRYGFDIYKKEIIYHHWNN